MSDLSLIERIATTLLHSLWQGILVWLVTVFLLHVGRRRGAELRYGIALLGLIAAVAFPVATFLSLSSGAPQVPAPSALTTTPTLPATAAAVDWSTWQPWVVAIWMTGMAFFAVRLVLGALGVRRLAKSGTKLPSDLHGLVVAAARKLRFRKTPRVRLSTRIRDACAVGLFRPMILLPASWVTKLPMEAWEGIIAHELAHLKRLDLWVLAVQRVIEGVFFFHPAIWRISQRVRWERELCCDGRAIDAGTDPAVYAGTLVDLAELRTADRRGRTAKNSLVHELPVLAAGLGGPPMNLMNRVEHALAKSARSRSRRGWTTLSVVMGLALFTVPAALVFNSAFADDEPDEKRAKKEKKERERAEGKRDREREGDRPRREGERDRERGEREKGERDRPRREGERDRERAERERRERDRDPERREGDRPRREGEPRRDRERPREGFRPPRERDPDFRRPPFRDGERPRAPREGERPRDPRPPIAREGGNPQAELMRAIIALRREVAELRAEVRRLRGQRGEGRREIDPPAPPRRDERPRRNIPDPPRPPRAFDPGEAPVPPRRPRQVDPRERPEPPPRRERPEPRRDRPEK